MALRSREKAFLFLGGVAAALILLLSLLVIPGIARVRTLSRAFSQAEKELAELRKIRPDLERADREVRQRMARVKAQGNAPESPATRLTTALQEAGFAPAAFSLRGSGAKDGEFVREETFDVKIENLTYLETAKLLASLENGPLPVAVRSIQMKNRYDDSKYLDATFRIGVLLPPKK